MKYIGTPTTIIAHYIAFLVVATGLCFWCVGTDTILEYACKTKPYAHVLDPGSRETLPDEASSGRKDAVVVLCFGDSNYFYPPFTVIIPKADAMLNLTEMISRKICEREGMPNTTVLGWHYPGASMFDYYCLYYEAIKFRPDIIVVPINWRSFGSPWLDNSMQSHHELSSFVPLCEKFPPDCENPLRARGISMAKQFQHKLFFNSLYLTGVKHWILAELRLILLLCERNIIPFKLSKDKSDRKSPDKLEVHPTMQSRFPMTVESSNATFQNLSALAHAASRRGTKTLFFVWPLDKQYLSEIGILDESALECSIQRIRKAVQKENTYFVDLSGLLRQGFFHDKLGHCKIQGRMIIAAALAPTILEILRENSSSESKQGFLQEEVK